MRIRKIKSHDIITWLLVIFFPLYSLPYTLYRMYHLERVAFIQFAFFMGLVGILYPPVGDFYRYTRDFFLIQDGGWLFFKQFISLKFDYLLYIYAYLIGLTDIHFDTWRFLYNFISYILLSNIFFDVIHFHREILNKYGRLALILCLIPFSLTGHIFRFGFSSALFIYGLYLLVNKNLNRGWWYITFAILNHFSFVIFGLIVVINRFIKIRTSLNLFIALFIFGVIVATSIDVANLFHKIGLPVEMVIHFDNYIDGYWATDYLADLTTREKTMRTIGSVFSYMQFFIFLIVYDKQAVKENQIILLMIILCIAFSPFKTLYGRFLGVTASYITIYMFTHYSKKRLSYYLIKILVIYTGFNIPLGLWQNRRQLSFSRETMLLNNTSIGILKNNYTRAWIARNVNTDGSLIKINY